MQKLLAITLLIGALGFLARRISLTLRKNSSTGCCGGGCGRVPETAEKQRVNF